MVKRAERAGPTIGWREPRMKPSTRNDYAERVLRVLIHVQEHLDTPLMLDELARLAHFSPFHFHRVFRGMVGESVKQHVRRLRLERAAVQLKTTTLPVIHVALNAGYETHESFTRAFRGAFRESPSMFRKASRGSTHIQSPSSVHLLSGSQTPEFEPLVMEQHPMEVKIRRLDPMRVAFLRHVGGYDEVGETWERLTDWAGANCLFGSEMHYFGASYDDPEVTAPEHTATLHNAPIRSCG